MTEKKILIVEDNAIVARETSERLKHLGYTVTGIAARGTDAIENARTSRPDLILMDINLKGDMDGIETATKIAEFSDAPVIYLTAYSDDETLQRARKTKPLAYLVKPFKERELYSNIELAMHRAKSEKVMTRSRQMEDLISSFSTLKEGVIVTDNEEKILFMNRSASALTGFSPGEILDQSLDSVVKIQRGDPALESILAKKPSGCPVLQEIRMKVTLVARSGQGIPVVTETIAINPVNGIPEGYALLFWPQTTSNDK